VQLDASVILSSMVAISTRPQVKSLGLRLGLRIRVRARVRLAMGTTWLVDELAGDQLTWGRVDCKPLSPDYCCNNTSAQIIQACLDYLY